MEVQNERCTKMKQKMKIRNHGAGGAARSIRMERKASFPLTARNFHPDQGEKV